MPEGSSSPPRPRYDRLEGHDHVCQGKQKNNGSKRGWAIGIYGPFSNQSHRKFQDWDSPAKDLLNGAIIRILQDGRLSA